VETAHIIYRCNVGTTLSVLLVTVREEVANIQNGTIIVAPCVKGHRKINKCLNLKYHSLVCVTTHTHKPLDGNIKNERVVINCA
jgi:hypothetical protein